MSRENENNCPFCGSDDTVKISSYKIIDCQHCGNAWVIDKYEEIREMRRKVKAWECVTAAIEDVGPIEHAPAEELSIDDLIIRAKMYESARDEVFALRAVLKKLEMEPQEATQ